MKLSHNQKRLKIIHIIIGLNTGGAEMSLYRLLSENRKEKLLPHVISLMDKGTLGSRIEALGIPVYCINLNKGSLFPQMIFSFRSFTRLLKDIQPDIIQGWMYHANLAALLGKLLLAPKVSVIWNIRQSLYTLSYEKRITALLIIVGAFLSRFPSKVLYNSQTSQKQHEKLGYDSTKGLVIVNGFDISEFKPSFEYAKDIRDELGIPSEGVVVGLVGRFHPMKDHQNFFQAIRHLIDTLGNGFNLNFVLCGNGICWNNPALVSLIESLNLPKKNLFLLGERDDIPCVTAAFDIATLSSYTEAFPNVVGEAMACGIPCVVTDVGEAARIVGKTGKVVPPQDFVALSQGLQYMIELSAEQRRLLGQAARRRIIDYFSQDQMAAQYASLYQSISGN